MTDYHCEGLDEHNLCAPWVQASLEQVYGAFHDFLISKEGRFYALFGGPQTGKSWLLCSLRQRLTLQRHSLPVLIDLAAVETPGTPQSFFQLLFREMREQLGICYIAPEEAARLFQSNQSVLSDFKQGFSYIVWQPQSKVQGKRLTLLLDNADILTELPFAAELFTHLSTLFSNATYKDSITCQLDLVLTGGNALYNQLAESRFARRDMRNWYNLAPLPASSVAALWAESSAAQGQPDLGAEIYQQTGGHPYLLRYFIAHLEAGDSLAASIAEALDPRSEVAYWFHDCLEAIEAQGARPLYTALALEHGPLNWAQIKAAIQARGLGDLALWLNPSAVDRALDTLLYHSLIRREGSDRYAINGELFCNWFMQEILPTTGSTSLQARAALIAALEKAQRVLGVLEQQAAAYTALTIPAHLQIELEEQQRKVAELQQRLGSS